MKNFKLLTSVLLAVILLSVSCGKEKTESFDNFVEQENNATYRLSAPGDENQAVLTEQTGKIIHDRHCGYLIKMKDGVAETTGFPSYFTPETGLKIVVFFTELSEPTDCFEADRKIRVSKVEWKIIEDAPQTALPGSDEFRMGTPDDVPEAISKTQEGKIIATTHCNNLIQFNDGNVAEAVNFPHFLLPVIGKTITVTYLPVLNSHKCKAADLKINMLSFYLHSDGGGIDQAPN